MEKNGEKNDKKFCTMNCNGRCVFKMKVKENEKDMKKA